jgi:hypothetical protein
MRLEREPPLTPLQRLSNSRQALIEQLQRDKRRSAPNWFGKAPDASSDHAGRPSGGPWGAITSHVLGRWWRRHPANAAIRIARPLLERYARKQPAVLVAAAAAIGALAVLFRPWRLLSATAILAAVFKSSDVADLVNTLMKMVAAPQKSKNK